MKRYVEVVVAEQFFVDKTPWPDGIRTIESYLDIYPQMTGKIPEGTVGYWSKPHPTLDGPGRNYFIKDRDWIVTWPNRDRLFFSPEDFERFFSPIEE